MSAHEVHEQMLPTISTAVGGIVVIGEGRRGPLCRGAEVSALFLGFLCSSALLEVGDEGGGCGGGVKCVILWVFFIGGRWASLNFYSFYGIG